VNCAGQLADMPRSESAAEATLRSTMGLAVGNFCILYQNDEIALVALAKTAMTKSAQLHLAWQTLSTARVVIIELCHQHQCLIDTRAAVTDWLTQLITYTLRQQASDVHLEPTINSLRIRIRVAGELITLQHLSADNGKQLIAHIKVLADLDSSEQRRSQDGRFSVAVTVDDKQPLTAYDFRVSTCAVMSGEKLVLRSLGMLEQVSALSRLGLTQTQLMVTSRALKSAQGLILVTGPTGSGKTSTLYSLLQRLNQRALNICTVEDPVEIRCPGINQVPVRQQQQLDFATILRTLLRQDPDVLMVGEIRDGETARVALQAAQTGHLVLASLHTSGALASFQRLQALGIPEAEIASALSLIVSQRLLRRLCKRCKGVGCTHCHSGYQGQLPCFEVTPWQADTLLKLRTQSLAGMLNAQQLPTLAQHANQLVKAGKTSAQQAARLEHASA